MTEDSELREAMSQADEIAAVWHDNRHRLNYALTHHDISLGQVPVLIDVYLALKSRQPVIRTLHVVYSGYENEDPEYQGEPLWYLTSSLRAFELATKDIAEGDASRATRTVPAVVVGNVAYLLQSATPVEIDIGPEEIAQQKLIALAKLTEAEKKLLGLI